MRIHFLLFLLLGLPLAAFAQNIYKDEQTGKYGMKDSAGQVRILPEFEALRLKGMFVVAYEGKYKGLFDLQGKRLLPNEYAGFDFTDNPRLLIGYIHTDAGRRAGLIDLDKGVDNTAFKYDYFQRFSTGYFRARIGDVFTLFDARGKFIYEGAYEQFGEPAPDQTEIYKKLPGATGTLVAIARPKGMPYENWIGINEAGKTLHYEAVKAPQAPVLQEAVAIATEEASSATTRAVEPPPPPGEGEEILNLAEQRPSFPGGEAAMLQFLDENLKYPALAKENGIQGRVIVRFVVEKDGSLSNTEILRDIGGGCGKEALRLLASMPRWQPGKQRGRAVRVRYTLPLSFRLE
ncbi:MAG: energy transducer TonB [Chitinophagales bacterium]|nr:energy transducer TonB [Chitinophagales bacterium]